VCALRGFVAFWQGQCRQLETQLHSSAQAAAAAQRTAAADMATMSSDVAHIEQRLQAAQQLERQLRQRQVLLAVRKALAARAMCIIARGAIVSIVHTACLCKILQLSTTRRGEREVRCCGVMHGDLADTSSIIVAGQQARRVS
jgi:hypothetical protein